MKRMIIAFFGCAMLFVVPRSYGQMMDMEKHMKDHMGGGMTGTPPMEDSSKEKQTGKEKAKAFTQEAEAAGVTLKVTYKNPEESKSPVFNVALDTHSVDLDRYKIEDVTILRDDKGKDYHPVLISASGSGHHREATLEFKDADISEAKAVELVVEGVAGVEERVFKFELQKNMMK